MVVESKWVSIEVDCSVNEVKMPSAVPFFLSDSRTRMKSDGNRAELQPRRKSRAAAGPCGQCLSCAAAAAAAERPFLAVQKRRR